jgi:hypothetical protein
MQHYGSCKAVKKTLSVVPRLTKIQGLVGTPLCMPPWGSQGVVLLSPKVCNGHHRGQELAIGIASFTTHYPLNR